MLSVACFVFQVTQTPPLFVKSSLEVTRVASPYSWFTIVIFVVLVNIDDVVAGEMGVREVRGSAGLLKSARNVSQRYWQYVVQTVL